MCAKNDQHEIMDFNVFLFLISQSEWYLILVKNSWRRKRCLQFNLNVSSELFLVWAHISKRLMGCGNSPENTTESFFYSSTFWINIFFRKELNVVLSKFWLYFFSWHVARHIVVYQSIFVWILIGCDTLCFCRWQHRCRFLLHPFPSKCQFISSWF